MKHNYTRPELAVCPFLAETNVCGSSGWDPYDGNVIEEGGDIIVP